MFLSNSFLSDFISYFLSKMSEVSFQYFVYRNRGEKALQLVERHGVREKDGKFSFVAASAKVPKRSWNVSEWVLKTSNSLRNDERGYEVMVASFAPFVMVNETTGERIRICENKVTTALPPRGKCEIPVSSEMQDKFHAWFKNPVSVA